MAPRQTSRKDTSRLLDYRIREQPAEHSLRGWRTLNCVTCARADGRACWSSALGADATLGKAEPNI
jgi:hypothetical protein